MDLQSLTKQLIYDEHNIETPDIYQKFGIVCPEYSSRDIEVKEYPMPDKEHLLCYGIYLITAAFMQLFFHVIHHLHTAVILNMA